MDITTAATALATLIAAIAAGIATWGKAKQESNTREIRDLKLSNQTLLFDLERDRKRYQNEIKELREMLHRSDERYALLHQEYLTVKEENISLRARVNHLEGLVAGGN